MFNMNEKELALAEEVREAAQLLFGADCVIRETYCFTTTSIAPSVDIELELTNGVTVRKNITDYDTW